MPSRIVTAAIILFWLTMTGWLVYREVVPTMIADASPTYTPDLTDEIGSPQISWTILHNGKRTGGATSQVISNADRSFTFRTAYRFRQFSYLGIEIRSIEVKYNISDAGKLQSLATKHTILAPLLSKDEIRLEMKGAVANGVYRPTFFLNDVEEKLPDFGEIRFDQTGNIVNPMHLFNRLRGLRDGQTWKVPRPDPLQGLKKQLPAAFAKQLSGSTLTAAVSVDTLEWDQREVQCFKIEYRELGKKDLIGRTWVRKADGLVLQQEQSELGMNFTIQRTPGQ
ncbi:MAG: hypothetical protein FJ303_02565 [Planctomycetes bacterium]|nr:hypothetical protein [Planctomycetota bacterium]